MKRRYKVIILLVMSVVLTGYCPAFGQAGSRLEQSSPATLRLVVIDPGHGGKDRGVIGPGGLAESRLTLALARRLKVALEIDLGAKVFLTREEDQNPGLAERTALANHLKADLFLSLHAGGAASGTQSGFDVLFQDYSLQAGLDNLVSSAGPETDTPPLWSLAQAPYTGPSQRLARELTQALSEVLRIKRRGPGGMPLAVLAGAAQPAVLIELGCLTNPEEERRLKSQAYRDALTRAIVRGVKSWQVWLRRSMN